MNKDYYHFPLLEVDGDLVNAHPPLDTILTITDQREILLDSPIRGLENVQIQNVVFTEDSRRS